MPSQDAAESEAMLIASQFRERIDLLTRELEAWARRYADGEVETAWYFRRAEASLAQARDDLSLAWNFLRADADRPPLSKARV